MIAQNCRYFFLSILIVIGIFGFSIKRENWTVPKQIEKEEIPELSLKVVTEDPAKYLGRTFRVSGKLRNKGKNYFTDLQLVLEDEKCNFIYVRPWIPLEFPPSPPGHPEKKKVALSHYLGKQVELTTTIEKGRLKIVGEVFFLNVKSAKILVFPKICLLAYLNFF